MLCVAAQGYVRAAAVAGAVTVLRQSLSDVVLETECVTGGLPRCTGVLTQQGQLLQCKQLVAGAHVLRWVGGRASLG